MYRYRRNPSIRLGARFFESAIRDYRNWREKWWREAIQNSVDAGATRIICNVVEDEETETYAVSCIDNGGGMDEDILVNKFLVLGETTKQHSGSIGGFGKAKELLILPWISWEIHSRDNLIQGQGDHYEISKTDQFLNGTRLTVVMSEDKYTTGSAAKAFIKKCTIPGVEFVVDGEEVAAALEPGELVDSTPNMDVYYNTEGGFKNKVLIRVGGICMFTDWVDKLEGTVTVEALGASIDIFTANRESFRDPSLRNEYKKFVTRITKDIRSGLLGHQNRLHRIYRGGKKFDPRAQDELADDISLKVRRLGLERVKTRGAEREVMSQASMEQFKNYLDGLLRQQRLEEEAKREFERQVAEHEQERVEPKVARSAVDGALAEALLKDVDIKGSTHMESIGQQLVWEPDFFLSNQIKDFEVPQMFFPEHMTARVQRLARFWAELCRFTLIQLGCNKKFGIGFIFSFQRDWDSTSWTRAQYMRESGDHWLMLNPYKGGDPEKGKLYSLSDENDIDTLYAMAIHECTHISDGIAYHDEDFASAITRNMAKCFRGRRNLRAINKAVGEQMRAEKEAKQSQYSGLKPEQGRGYYSVHGPGFRGKKFRTLADARLAIDTKSPNKQCWIDAHWWDFVGGPTKVRNVEYRYQKVSYPNKRSSRPFALEDSLHRIRETWREQHPNHYLDPEIAFLRRRNPRGLRRRPRRRLRRRYRRFR